MASLSGTVEGEVSANNLYFNLQLRTEEECFCAVSYSLGKHKSFDAKAETSSPLKITNYQKKRNKYTRVWKGASGIRDLTKIWCGNRKTLNILVGSRISLLSRKQGTPKFGHRTQDFFCLSGRNSGNCHNQINVLAAKANQPGKR